MFENSPEAWQRECEMAASNISRLLRLAKRSPFSAQLIIESLRSVPHLGADMKPLDRDALYFRLLEEARDFSEYERDVLQGVITYFEQRLMRMPAARRAMLEASVVGVLLGYGTV